MDLATYAVEAEIEPPFGVSILALAQKPEGISDVDR